mmetsp:Transcript_42763/g.50122  ORF Transcript_42763/g.50122 Transcript_42763/m.50122 type:complete len:207 (+) Transcript_42763:817-1437(+)
MLNTFSAQDQKKRFDAAKEDRVKALGNLFYSEPAKQGWEYLDSMLFSNDYPKHLMLKSLKDMTFDRFVELCEDFMKSATHLWFFVGNLTADDAIRISKSAENTFPVSKVPREECHQRRVICLAERTDTVLKVRTSNLNEGNSAVIKYFQSRQEVSLQQSALHIAVFKYIENPSYDYLRTQNQLGYTAYSMELNYRKVLGGGFCVQL